MTYLRDSSGFRLTRRIVCKRCHVVIRDCEPGDHNGNFVHRRFEEAPHCPNEGKQLKLGDGESEIFLHKGDRRKLKRGSKRAAKNRP